MYFKSARIKPFYILLSALILVMIAVAVTFIYRAELFYAARYVDKRYFAETLKDLRARLETDEDWNSIAPHAPYQYQWLKKNGTPVKIAHGLGTKPENNTFAAFEKSRLKGFHLYEVDIFLDDQNHLRCHHGPERPTPYMKGDCTLPVLVNRLNSDEYLVLDLKTPFAQTVDAVLTQIKVPKNRDHLIFQLYLPEHVTLFHKYNETSRLPGPIVSVYNSKRSLNHVFASLSQTGIRAFAIPYPRIPALTKRQPDIALFTYPVKDCRAQKDAFAYGIYGLYTPNDLKECQTRK